MSTEAPQNSVQVESRAEWRAWLAENHARTEGLWLITYKKRPGRPHVSYDEVVEEALCFGWIDSKGNKLDDERTMLWMAPRKPDTGWSALNKKRITVLAEAELIMPPGLAKIEAAKLDGSWELLDAIERLEVPADLAAAFRANEVAWDNFDAFPRSAKRGILEWIASAKRAETRERRIAKTVELAAQNLRANSWPKRPG
ncbi:MULTISPECIES: YdeI/OmpD-associated family protein [Cyanophyceae]|uniref:YdeI/OmpD-associated family protein n=1 Tax=Cyanophyceae TaxID=3028117 RepID=UPI0016843AF5|nr:MULTISPECIES: YdeI/OmpD-associated family protein [Cyanophyceae]MBD1915419.1 YdeI/OmpD-associated family protein [Phormidium sp. FACHB-77]MBD2032420.1 YdeI/OmpD-associated family protein [Phormidium sp. FACHB-322]MBD2052591.1 YdeI/OmpD-associated family protein [Leptolyngbya sp. FACHB-60]